MNPQRQKGTGGEREVLLALQVVRSNARRTQAGSQFDIESQGTTWTIKALATRPDRGRWLVTVPLQAFTDLISISNASVLIECKRRKRFAHHTLYEEETA